VGSWGAIAYTQFGSPVMMQVVSVFGLWGVTFLVGWLASLVNWAWEQGFGTRAARRGLAAGTVGALLIVVAAYSRLWLAPNTPETVPTSGTATLYSAIGDLLGWVSALRLIVLALWAIVAGRRSRRTVPTGGLPSSA
jgi:apolipoprotein N-acyltransferase